MPLLISVPATFAMEAADPDEAVLFVVPVAPVGGYLSGFLHIQGSLDLEHLRWEQITIDGNSVVFPSHGIGAFDSYVGLSAAQLVDINAAAGGNIAATVLVTTNVPEDDPPDAWTESITSLVMYLEDGTDTPVTNDGFVDYTDDGVPLLAADLNANFARTRDIVQHSLLPGVMEGGVCTGSGLNVTVPAGTKFFATAVWSLLTGVVVPIPQSTIQHLWGCGDGIVRVGTGVDGGSPPTGFTLRNACRICGVSTDLTTATVDLTVQQRSRYVDATTGEVTDGPLTIDYFGDKLKSSAVPTEPDDVLRLEDVGSAALSATVATADATVTNLLTWVPDVDKVTMVRARVIGRKSDGSAGAAYLLIAAFRRTGAVVTQIGATVNSVVVEDNAAWNATIDTDATLIRIRVTGVAATTITWETLADTVEVT